MLRTKFATLAALVVLSATAAHANFQQAAVTVDGTITDINDTPTTAQTVPGSFGAGACDLYNMRLSNDATNLYLGVSAKVSTDSGTRGVWVIFDSVTSGANTLSSPGGTQAAKLDGTVMESGFNADHIFFMQNGDGGNRQNYFLNVTDLNAASEVYYGSFDVVANSFSPAGSLPAGVSAAVNNTETASNPSGAASATKGFEFKLPLSLLGLSTGNTVKVLVGSGDGGNGFWSSQTLPSSNNNGNDGQAPNFQTNTIGQFGTAAGFSGTQSASYQIFATPGAAVSDWNLYQD